MDARDIRKAVEEFAGEHGRDPSYSEIADLFGVGIMDVVRAMREEGDRGHQADPKARERVYRYLMRPRNRCGVHYRSICEDLGLSEGEVLPVLSSLVEEGNLRRRGDIYGFGPFPGEDSSTVVHSEPVEGKKRFRFAVVGDTHYGSKFQQPSALSDFLYDAREDFGIEFVLHLGDLVDGRGVYRGQDAEIFLHSMDDQLRYAVEAYPDVGIPTYIISGNHDQSFLQKVGANIVRSFCHMRPDCKYVGERGGYVEAYGVRFYLWHPTGKGPANKQSALMKWVNETNHRMWPDFLFAGHWHQDGYIRHQSVNCFLVPSWQGQSSFLTSLGIDAKIGGIVMEVGVKDGRVEYFVPHRSHVYDPVERNYPHYV